MAKAYTSPKSALIGGLILLSLAPLLGLAIIEIDFSPLALGFPLYLAVLGIIMLVSLPHTRRLAQHRQAAAGGEQTFLAIEQPTPSETSLPLPTTIKIRANIVWQLIFCLSWVPVFLVASGLAALYQGDYSLDLSQHGILQGMPTFLIQSMSLAAGLFILSILNDRERLEVTREGLSVSLGTASGRVQQVQWGEALLFAIYAEKGKAGTIQYELSSPTASVRWKRLRQQRWSSWRKPALPFDEYDRQMEALLSLIAAKTGLPLYDLRG